MVPVWMTFSDFFKVTIIQRQITRKWYNTQLYLPCPTNRKSYMIYRTAPFSEARAVSLRQLSFLFEISELLTIRYSHTKLMVIPQKVQELSFWQTSTRTTRMLAINVAIPRLMVARPCHYAVYAVAATTDMNITHGYQ